MYLIYFFVLQRFAIRTIIAPDKKIIIETMRNNEEV